MSNSIFVDQHYVNQIRKRLWCGKVAVMVGAGFSLNANRISQASSKFLLWHELIREMKSDLFPNENIEVNTATSEALKLASEYELVFGRQALDELILRSLPDQNYVPGDLHKLLISLPWSDVFTTNYDTLLERTRMYIHDRKYDLVLNSADLPMTSKPRIIKLHGSFPSNRPFIITEEDYRTYPRKFSAFINTVQQSIMENALCLIGFSGDDPNFLNWIGWVRDNLGMNTPPIYFCGFVSQSVKRSLESRGIVSIDLSPLFTEEKYLGGLKYSKGLEWFLLNLKNGKEFDIMKWPSIQQKVMKNIGKGLPEVPAVDFNNIENLQLGKMLGFELRKEELIELTGTWRRIRLKYPGWVIAPKSKREKIWLYTERHYIAIMNSLKCLSIQEKLELLYELNWRFEIVLMPLMVDLVKSIDSVINEINSFEDNTLEGQENREKWVELNFAIAKHEREEQNEIKFLQCINRLQPVIDMNLEWKVKWYYEKCLFNLTIFNQNELLNILSEWPTTNEMPFWEIKRASILAEIGKLKDAERVAEEALNKIRLMVSANQIDISILSQEGWSMVLLRALKDNDINRIGSNDYNERLTILSNYGCNPHQEINVIKEVLKSSVPNHEEENKITKGFDRGIITKHFSFGRTIKEEVKLSYAFLKMFENAAIPFQCGNVKMFSEELAKSAKWIKRYSPFLSISIMLRCNAEKDLKDSITRLEVARLSEEEVKQYYDVFIPALNQAVDNEPLKGYSYIFYNMQIQNLGEMVSRLCIRFSSEQLEEVLNVALRMFKSQRLQRDEILNKYIESILYRVFSSMSDKQKAKKLVEMLKLSIQMEYEYKINSQNFKVDLFQYLYFDQEYNFCNDYDINELSEGINKSLSFLKDDDLEVRERALTRLVQLFNINALSDEQVKVFGEVLWEKTSENTGLPDYNHLYTDSYLNLPSPDNKDVKEIILNRFLSQDIPLIYQQQGKGQISSLGDNAFKRYIIEWIRATDSIFINNNSKKNYIKLNKDNAIKLLNKIDEWWQEQKSNLSTKSRFNTFVDNEEIIELLISFLSIVVLLNLDLEDNDAKDKVRNIIDDVGKNGYNTIFATPMLVNLEICSEDVAQSILTEGLLSSNNRRIKSTIEAIIYWLWYGEKKVISKKMPIIILNDLVNKLYWRKQPKLTTTVEAIINIVKNIPQCLDDKLINKICVALEYILDETDINLTLKENFEGLKEDLEELTDQRYYSAKLSKVMYELMQNLNKDIPKCLIMWQEASKKDPLSEVRNLWEE